MQRRSKSSDRPRIDGDTRAHLQDLKEEDKLTHALKDSGGAGSQALGAWDGHFLASASGVQDGDHRQPDTL